MISTFYPVMLYSDNTVYIDNRTFIIWMSRSATLGPLGPLEAPKEEKKTPFVVMEFTLFY